MISEYTYERKVKACQYTEDTTMEELDSFIPYEMEKLDNGMLKIPADNGTVLVKYGDYIIRDYQRITKASEKSFMEKYKLVEGLKNE